MRAHQIDSQSCWRVALSCPGNYTHLYILFAIHYLPLTNQCLINWPTGREDAIQMDPDRSKICKTQCVRVRTCLHLPSPCASCPNVRMSCLNAKLVMPECLSNIVNMTHSCDISVYLSVYLQALVIACQPL